MMNMIASVASFTAVINLLRLSILSDAYNVEVRKVGIVKGHEGTQFGYTVALVPSPGWKTDKLKNKTLLVGAPNETYKGIGGHGQLYKCSDFLMKKSTCKLIDTSGTSKICDRIRKGDNRRSACEQDSRLGSSLAVNRFYIENLNPSVYDSMQMVMVCAPGWKNTFFETKQGLYQNYMVGKCIKLTHELKTIPCSLDKQFGCWPFWAKQNTANLNGRPLYSYAEGGFSSAFTKDGYDIVGGPGVNNWQGAFASQRKKWSVIQNHGFQDTTYFGYDLKAGNLMIDANIFVGEPNFRRKNQDGGHTGHTGRVLIYKGEVKKAFIEYGIYYECVDSGSNRLSKTAFEKLIKTEQNGNKFGAVLESVDLNGDGFDEILVAAPLYTGDYPDEGRVFVYTFSKTGVCGPITVLSGGARYENLKEKTKFARFGTCITSIGDLDNSLLKDVAIGAPYEDGGVGAVYIYNDAYNNLKDQFTQRITGQTVDPGIRTFGWSMYGNEDIDNNGFPDIVVGAYESDRVVVLRSRPVVSVNFDMTIDPNPIPLTTSLQNCSSDTSSLCFTAQTKFSFKIMGLKNKTVKTLAVSLSMKADTFYMAMEDTSRVVFLETNSSKLVKNLTLENNILTEEDIPLLVLGNPEPKDVWTKVSIACNFEILESGGNDFDHLDPVIYKDNIKQKIVDVEFDNDCDKLEKCSSDLQVKLDSVIFGKDHTKNVANDTVIYVGEGTELMITVDVRSGLGMSHNANFTTNVSVPLSRPVSPDHGIIGASCQLMDVTNTKVVCRVNNTLFLHRNIKVKFYYNISTSILLPDNDLDRMKEFIKIDIEAEQQNIDVSKENNVFEGVIPIRLKHKIVVQEDDNVEDQIFYDDDEKSERHLNIKQRYYVSNRGPSFLHFTYVNISVPVRKGGVQIAIIKNVSNICTKSVDYDGMFEVFTDEQPERGTYIHKEMNATSGNNGAEDEKFADFKTISCFEESYECAVIECKVSNMAVNQEEVIEFSVDVFEKELAKEKSIYGIRYATFADVSDPYTWYGNKSVAWTKPVYTQKWTTFVPTQDIPKPTVTLWIVIVSGIGGFILLGVITIILWKCHFFEREKHYRIMDWKERSRNESTSQNIVSEEM